MPLSLKGKSESKFQSPKEKLKIISDMSHSEQNVQGDTTNIK